MSTSGKNSPKIRYPALDGLRGLAALVVVIHHCMLVWPAAWNAIETGQGTGWLALLVFSPLHIFWAGTEAVILFFVLSGFVLAVPYCDTQGTSGLWWGYFTQRLLRLYLPVGASLVLAVATYALVSHAAQPGSSGWLASHDIAITPGLVARDFALLGGTSWINSPLWSLRLEVAFSLLLPVVVACVRTRRRWLQVGLAVFVAAGLVVSGLMSLPPISYALMFVTGALLAKYRQHITALAIRLSRRDWVLLTSVGVVCLLAGWWPVVGRSGYAAAISTVGAALLVVIFVSCPGGLRVGTARPVAWIGKRSFSLYLVHEPIVVSTALLLRTANPLPVLLLALPGAVLITAGFYRWVEVPTHRAARAAGVHAIEYRRGLANVRNRHVRAEWPGRPG